MNSSNHPSQECREIEILLTEYAAGDLDPATNDTVRLHLDGCAGCRAELQREFQLRELMGALPVRYLPLDVADLAPAPSQVAGTAGRLRRWLAPSAAIAAMLALVLLAGRFGPGPDRKPQPALRAEAPASSRWSEQDVERAQDQVEYTLALTARLLKRSEQSTVQEVFGNHLPRAITDSLRKTLSNNEGDQG